MGSPQTWLNRRVRGLRQPPRQKHEEHPERSQKNAPRPQRRGGSQIPGLDREREACRSIHRPHYEEQDFWDDCDRGQQPLRCRAESRPAQQNDTGDSEPPAEHIEEQSQHAETGSDRRPHVEPECLDWWLEL